MGATLASLAQSVARFIWGAIWRILLLGAALGIGAVGEWAKSTYGGWPGAKLDLYLGAFAGFLVILVILSLIPERKHHN